MTTTTENILNVTLLEPKLKHPTIFNRFDELAEGSDLTIHNDHDPKPLYYQMLGERGNVFKWEYLEQGPEWWKVRITKKLRTEQDETIGEIAAKDLKKAEIFKKYGLDFCCGGKKTVKEACAEKGLDVAAIEDELQKTIVQTKARELPYNDWSLDFLADYIINTHHSYLRKNMPDILKYSEKVATVHGHAHEELHIVYNIAQAIDQELNTHMMKEERVLFPYIKELQLAANNKTTNPSAHFGTVKNPINMMEMEHEMLGNNLKELRIITNNYQLPPDACNSYRMLFKMLFDMEEDLHLHIHLENNILFPKAIELEKKLNS
jgi:regulator of cell morphogenesis and NO signaling